MKQLLRKSGVALTLMIALVLGQVTWALAGTTGGISGNVFDEKGAPVVAATVTASAASGTSTTTTDASGHFVFLTLGPDTYTVSMKKDGYNPVSQGGVTVFADNTVSVALHTEHSITEIGHVTSKAANDLVKSGTTSDVYSVNAATATKVGAIGGGTNLNSAYSAVASQPGVMVSYGGMGWGQQIYIHGASYSQVGYEFDGVPVNRAFDNYNANTLTNLGQQELQVYTGGAQAASSSSTVGGFINQVIRTGTYPGFGTGEVGLASPSYYHALHGEAGGATPNRMFSYYVGLLGYDQQQRFVDQFDGGSLLPNIEPPNTGLGATTLVPFLQSAVPYCNPDGTDPRAGLGALDAGCQGGPFPTALGAPTGLVQDRESVANIHIAIPHHNDSGRDDIQLLYNGSFLRSFALTSINDYGGLPFLQAQLGGCGPTRPGGCTPAVPHWIDSNIVGNGVSFGQTIPVGGTLPSQTFFFPSSPTNRTFDAPIPTNLRDAVENDAQIVKFQYTHNMGSNAYLRFFGYSFYSDWLQNAPTAAALNFGGPNILFAPYSFDYELITHTKGGELQFADQINPQHLLQATANFTTANVSRFNNSTFAIGANPRVSSLVDANGNCYDTATGALDACFANATRGRLNNPAPHAIVGQAALAGAQYTVTSLGPTGTLNKVTPKFSSYSLTDQWRPNDKLLINLGARLEQFEYDMLPSSGPDFNFWFKAAQNDFCYDPANGNAPVVGNPVPFNLPPLFSGLTCPNSPISGKPTLHPNGQNGALLYSNISPPSYTVTKLEPRFSGTYTFDPDNVLRLSIGRYANPFNTATVQYLNASAQGAASFDFQNFFGLGYTTPFHGVQPAVSTNADLSFEHRFKNSDVSFKL
ncbi:MAG: Plug domain-containing protein, partial [Candidatus Eremiobacteraeota bacterium]|nr:Plug domain-containing protein [Candidatus Eremiobacteraeota bacterium]